jgi:hypothetical protein
MGLLSNNAPIAKEIESNGFKTSISLPPIDLRKPKNLSSEASHMKNLSSFDNILEEKPSP